MEQSMKKAENNPSCDLSPSTSGLGEMPVMGGGHWGTT